MLTHDRVWGAIDALASQYGLTASGLARRAGLDPTSFNKSKRVSPEGRERWPSTESVSKILRATGASLEEFLRLVEPSGNLSRSMVPMVPSSHPGIASLFTSEGLPNASVGWDEIEFPDVGGQKVVAVEVAGNAMLPFYRDGDILVISPTDAPRKGDRIIACMKAGGLVAAELNRRTANALEAVSLDSDGRKITIPSDDVVWIGKIIWASQ